VSSCFTWHLCGDLVTPEDGQIAFFLPFDDFNPPALPTDLDWYRHYRRRSVDFIKARNNRIRHWAHTAGL